MGLRIQNNIAALNAHRNLTISDSAMSKSLERLSSGYRINRAADDAAGLAISTQFRADIASYKAASRNAAEANSLLQTAEGAMDQISNMLTRLKELATQASSSNASSNLEKINQEGNALLDEIDRIASSTEYAGSKLLDGSFGIGLSAGGTMTATDGLYTATGLKAGTTYTVSCTADGTNIKMTVSATIGGQQVSQTLGGLSAPGSGETNSVRFDALGLTLVLNDKFAKTSTGTIIGTDDSESAFQVGAKNTSNDRISISLSSVKATDTSGLNLSKNQLDDATEAQTFLASLDTAIATLSTRRSTVGAAQNQLSYASAILATTIENATASESVIRDVDMAAEMTTFTKNQILMQAGTSMLAQANMAPQQILSLFG